MPEIPRDGIPQDVNLRILRILQENGTLPPAAETPRSVCARCHGERRPLELTATVRGSLICGSCLSSDYVPCPQCGGWNRHGVACGNGCRPRRRWRCDDCYGDVLEADLTRVGYGYVVCTACRDARWWRCEQCQQWQQRRYADRAEECSNGCTPCGCGCGYTVRELRQRQITPSMRLVHNYSYKPEPRFLGAGPVYLGAEIEVATPYMEHYFELAQLAVDKLGAIAYLKEDSSIGTGFEIVTHPMSYDFAMGEFPWDVLPELAERSAEVTDQTGLHVHVSRAGFSGPLHTYRWMKFIYRNQTQVIQVARRHSDRWAAFSPVARKYAKEYAKGADEYLWTPGTPSLERYQAINVQNDATLELRIFASSLKPVEVQAALGFVAASVEYTRGLRARDVMRDGGWGFDRFAAWVSERAEYAPLTGQISKGGQICAF